MNLNILIIYQNEDLYKTLSSYLVSKGDRTTCIPCDINSVEKALQICPDLAIIEIALAELQAIEIINHLRLQRRSERKHLPVIVISDFPSLEFELLNISAFICKPVELERLRESIDNLAGGGNIKEASAANANLSPEELKIFQNFLIVQSGLYFDRHNIKILERGLNKRMATLRVRAYNEYYEYLTESPERRQELQKLLQFLTVGESFFFRQHDHFIALMKTVLPDIIKKRGGKKIRLLSAGCSTGEEPYSMAMAVMEAVPDWKRHDIRILGADINNHSLMRALEGGYNSWKVRVTDNKYLEKYFNRKGDSYVVKDEVKTLVDFIHLDLRNAHTSSNRLMTESFDVIFCRNVMIYFTTETIKKVVENFASALKPGGYLLLGHSETLSHISTKFERHLDGGAFFYRKRDEHQPSIEKTLPPETPIANAINLNLPDITTPEQQLAPVPVKPEESLNLEVLYIEAVARKKEKNYVAAEKLFRQVLDGNPTHKDAIVGEAMVLAYTGMFSEALESCNRALMIDDLLPEAYFVRGFAYDMTERKTEAIDEYRKAILLKTDFVMPHYQLGKLYFRTGQHKYGKQAMKNSLKLLELGSHEAIIPFSGGMQRDAFLERLRNELNRIDAVLTT